MGTSCLNLSGDESPECPLCMELFELDDINFYPCSCGYQICRFCWNKIRTEGSGLCPACRSPYSENPADFKPLTAEELAKIKAEYFGRFGKIHKVVINTSTTY